MRVLARHRLRRRSPHRWLWQLGIGPSLVAAGLLATAAQVAGAHLSLEGLVTGDDGRPLAEARVEARRPADAATLASATVAESGRFSLEVPAAGVWEVVARAPGHVAMSLAPLPVVEPRTLPPVALPPAAAGAGDGRADDGWRIAVAEERRRPPGGGPAAVIGRVLDAASRRPVKGALVWSGGDPGRSTSTDPQGRYRLAVPAGRSWIQADAPGYLPQATWVSPPDDGPGTAPTLALEPAAEVRGAVTDRQGRPVAGAMIEAASLTPAPRPRVFRLDRALGRDLSDAEGRFALRRLDPAGSYALSAKKAGFGPGRGTAGGSSERRPAVQIVLPPARRAFGRVVDGRRRPLAEVEVALRPADPGVEATTAGTGADGRFEVAALPAPRLDVEARKPGFAPLSVRGVQAPAGDGPVDLGTLVLVAGTAIDGAVSDGDGEPVAGAALWMTEDTGRPDRSAEARRLRRRPPTATTGPRGRFRLDDLEPGRRWRLLIDADGFLPAWVMGVAVPAPEPVRVTLAPASRIRGEVVDREGAPIAGARVVLRPEEPPLGTVGVVLPRPEDRRSGSTGDAGRFELDKVVPGQAELSVTADGFQPSETISLEVPPAGLLDELRLVLARGAVLEGSVVDGRGAPVVGARLRAEGASATSDGDGLFRLDGLGFGKQVVIADHPRYNRLRRELELTPEPNRADLVMEGGPLVAGWVIDERAEPLPAVRLELRRRDGTGQPYRESTDAEGQFRFPAVTEGAYELRAALPGFAAESRGLVVSEPIDDLEIELRRGGTIAGRLLDLELEELATARVEAERDDGRPATPGRVDYRGNYEIADLEPGDWRVRAAVAGGARQVEAWLVLEPGIRRLERDLDFGDGSTLAGDVTRGGEPLAETMVSVTGYQRGVSRSVTTDHRGRYRFEGVSPGRYRLAVTNPRELLLHNEDVDVDGDRELDVELAAGRIDGFVVSAADGEPIAQVQILIQQLLAAEDARPGSIVSLTTDVEGIFRAARLAAGRHRLRARKSGFVPLERSIEIPAGGAARHVELALVPTRGLNLHVRLASGGVPRVVNLHVFDAAGRLVLAESRRPTARGVVPFATVPPGTWTLRVSAAGAVSDEVLATVPGEPLALVLADAAQLTVRVPSLMESNLTASLTLSAPDGSAFRGVGPGGVLLSEWRLIGGRATVDRVPAGPWTVRVVASDGQAWLGTVAAGAGGSAVLTLD